MVATTTGAGTTYGLEVEEGRRKRPVTWGNWLVETVPDLANVAAQVTTTTTAAVPTTTKMTAKMIEALPPIKTTAALRPPPRAHIPHAPSVASQAFSYYSPSMIGSAEAFSHVDFGPDADKKALERSASEASRRRVADFTGHVVDVADRVSSGDDAGSFVGSLCNLDTLIFGDPLDKSFIPNG